MKLGVRGKLFAVSLLLISAVGLTSGLYLEDGLERWLERRIEGELSRHARAASDAVEIAESQADQRLDQLADRLARSTAARITIIAGGGVVVGDSDLDAEALRRVENHGARPEVRAALEHGSGIARRYSTTVRTDMLYLAVPYQGADGRGVVRAAMPLSEIDEAVGRLRMVLLVAALMGLVLAVFMSGLASHLATRELRRLVESARAVGKGDGAKRLAIASTDELGHLVGSFNRVVGTLDRTVNALAGERDHLETILDSMEEGVLALDSDQRISRLNRGAIALLGLDDAPSGQPLLEAIRVPALAKLASADPKQHEGPAEFQLPGPRHIVAQAAPLRTGGCVIVMRDVTRTRRLERIRQDFVANVSHELRTPVSVIRANAETLLDGAIDDPDRARVFLEAMNRNADRLSRLTADLLDLSRIEAGEHRLSLDDIAIAPVLRRVVDSLEAPARSKKLSVELDLPEDLEAHADSDALEQVALNLIDNAVKYSAPGGRVTIRARPAEALVRVEVSDHGPGIEPRHRTRVFERFYRADPSRSREIGGTGLGLAIVKHLVEAMHGEVGFEPGAPSGSIFWFTLPRQRRGGPQTGGG